MSEPKYKVGDIVQCEQGSAEWFAQRLGHLTSSRIADAVAKRKRGDGDLQCRIDLRLELAVERITNKPMEHVVTAWMERGIQMEPAARFAYEQRTDTETGQVGFVLHPEIQWAGCSPDGLVGAEGLVEFKCPKNTTHAEYLLAECVPEIYVPQMMWQMACTGRAWCDFVSFCDSFPAPLDLFVCRLPRDDERIAAMEAEARKFLDEVAATVTQLKGGLEGVLRQSLEARHAEKGPHEPPNSQERPSRGGLVPRAVIPPMEKELA